MSSLQRYRNTVQKQWSDRLNLVMKTAAVTKESKLMLVEPSTGEAGQFVYIVGTNLLSSYIWIAKWSHQDDRDMKSKVCQSTFYDHSRIGIQLPNDCNGIVTIECFDESVSELIDSCQYVVIALRCDEHPSITKVEPYILDWVYIDGSNFWQDSQVIIRCDSRKFVVKAVVYSQDHLGFRMPSSITNDRIISLRIQSFCNSKEHKHKSAWVKLLYK